MDTSTSEDYYALLGIDGEVGEDELRRSWRELALKWHPDRAGPAAAPLFHKISIAYATLSDPAARAAYDRAREGRPDGTQASAAAPVRPAPGVRLSRLSGPLNALLARGVARCAEQGVIELFLDGLDAAAGGMIDIAMRVPVRCPACTEGAAAGCARCSGQGAVDDLFSAWLAVRPDVADGTMLTPSAWLPGMIRPIYFRVRLLPS